MTLVAADSVGSGDEAHFVDHLVEKGVLSKEAGGRLSSAKSRSSQPLDLIATELGIIREEDLARELSDFFDMPLPKSDDLAVDHDLANRLGRSFLTNHQALPIKSSTGVPTMAIANPFDRSACGIAEFALEEPVALALLTRSAIERELLGIGNDLEPQEDDLTPDLPDGLADGDLDRLQDIASQVPVIRFLTDTIQNAVQIKATDIHIEPTRERLDVRFRVDGVLQQASSASRTMHAGVVTRIKVLARLNIAENRRPQDGRIRVTVKGGMIDLRVSILPSIFGETVVLRILDKSSVPLDLEKLGFDADARASLAKLAHAPNGIILVTGPTGSGKTTTLYALLRSIVRTELKIVTIEDPVEYELDGATQLNVNPDIDFTFANALRAVLRHDPKVILVGEIRDQETAEIAIRAALSGHLVLSTLHTNSAIGAIARLRDMGIENFLLGATLRGIVAQRLLRQRCQSCLDGAAETNVCAICKGTGYHGRTVCHEILPVSQTFADAVSSSTGSPQLIEIAVLEGVVPMRDHADVLVANTLTSPEEVRRVISLGD